MRRCMLDGQVQGRLLYMKKAKMGTSGDVCRLSCLGAYTFTCEQEIVQQDTAMGVGVPELY